MVEHSTENAGVGSSILPLGNNLISGSGSVVEHLLAKEKVASSNLVFRSILYMKGNLVYLLIHVSIITRNYLDNYLNPNLQHVVVAPGTAADCTLGSLYICIWYFERDINFGISFAYKVV